MKSTVLLGFLALLSACTNSSGHSSSAASDSSGSTTQQSTGKPASSAAGNTGSEIAVTITGGSHAGTYTASSPQSTCSMGLTGEKSFGNQYSVDGKKDNELGSVQLMAQDYEQAKKGTQDFSASITFGTLLGGTTYDLNPARHQGTGTLTISEQGNGRVAKVEGTTKDGVKIDLVITCKTTQQMVNGELKDQ